MKSIILMAICFYLSTGFGEPLKNEKTLFKKMEISCEFFDDESKFLEGVGYSTTAEGEISFAEIEIYKQTGSRKSKLSTYKLTYVKSKDLSLVIKFEDTQRNIKLEVFGDDMGGMSSLVVDNKKVDLTCMVEDF